MRTKQEYFDGLKKLKKNLYYKGEVIGRDHEALEQAAELIGQTFDAAQDPEESKLVVAKSHLIDEPINRFCHVHQSCQDLHDKQDMTRMLCRRVGFCIGRCMGVDALNAINAVSYEADKANGGKTKYYENFTKWLAEFQRKDLVGCCAQTDVKGERMKRPAQQTDPDAYLHVVEKRDDGIVVRGCKVHITMAAVADEIIALPTRSLGPDEGDYAVAFAIPADAEGVKQVLHPHNMRKREHYDRGYDWGVVDSYVIFDDVFVPWDRVFLCGESMHGGILALLFALFHRHSYSGCKPAVGDIMLGMAAMAAEINGIEKTSHVRHKLSEFIKVTELGYAAGFTASSKGAPMLSVPGLGKVPFGPGSYIPDVVYANVGRCLTGEAVFHEQELLCDIAGGMPSTFPYEQELTNPDIKPLMEKYLKRDSEMPIEDQIKMWLYFQDITTSNLSGTITYGAYHGGGSPIMEQIAIVTQYDIKEIKDNFRKLAGMSPAPKKKKK